jgi:hypothetical protein
MIPWQAFLFGIEKNADSALSIREGREFFQVPKVALSLSHVCRHLNFDLNQLTL